MQAPSERDKKRFKKAMDELNSGSPREAIKLFDKVRKSWGDNPDIWYLAGLAYGKLNDMKKVKQVSMRALDMEPGHFGALCNLANAQIGLDETEAALKNYDKALLAKPEAPEVLDNYGRALASIGRREEAVEYYQKAIKCNPHHGAAYAALARTYAESGKPIEALKVFRQALKLTPNLFEAHVGIGALFCGMGGKQEAEFHFNEALRINKQDPQIFFGLATARRIAGDFDGALDALYQAERYTEGSDPKLLAIRADVLEHKGDKEQAYSIVSQLLEGDIPPKAIAVYSRVCRKYDNCAGVLEHIDRAAERPEIVTTEKQMLMYAAGDFLDKSGDYDEAMAYYHKANNLVDVQCNRDRYEQNHNDLISCFSKQALAEMPRAQTASKRPIFILGMPRSGTSLTEQILASHKDVYGAGELEDIKKISTLIKKTDPQAGGYYPTRMENIDQTKLTELANTYLGKLNDLNSEARYVTDKMPHNFLHIGLISVLFPDARIIHCKRNPLDNCLSIYFQNFIWTHDYALDLADTGFFYSEYERIMQHWENVIENPILTVQYEDMVADQEAVSRKIFEFCDLEWDDSALDFHKTKRNVSTASYDQVRQPIYKSSMERWRNYYEHIRPLYDELPDYLKNKIDLTK